MSNTAPLWSPAELSKALAPQEIRGEPAEARGVSIDTRTLQPGDLFIALSGDPGPDFYTATPSDGDGHDYLQHAMEQGAAAAVVSRFVDLPLPQYKVENTLHGLWDLAGASRRRTDARVIALTGSSGKTTLKHFLAAATEGYVDTASLNNFWGVPLSLARLPKAAEVGIFELGMNRPGEIARLAKLVEPHIAIVLNALPAHLDAFADVSAIAQEKLSIQDGLVKEYGRLIMSDTLMGEPGLKGTCFTFGISEGADLRLLTDDESAECVLEASADALRTFGLPPTGKLSISLPAAGQHRQLTATAAMAAALLLKRDPVAAADALSKVSLPSGRGNRIQAGGGITLIDESYNANPASMAATLKALRAEAGGKKYAILGDMLELGEATASYHKALAGDCEGLAGVWLVGEFMPDLAASLRPEQIMATARAASELDCNEIAGRLKPGDLLVVKGSNKVFWQHNFARQLIDAIS